MHVLMLFMVVPACTDLAKLTSNQKATAMSLDNITPKSTLKAAAGGGWLAVAVAGVLAALGAWFLFTGNFESPLEALMMGSFSVLFAVGAVYAARSRAAGGVAQLELPQEPVPFGLPQHVVFRPAHPVPVGELHTRVVMLFHRDEDSDEEFWRQDFTAIAVDATTVESIITLPATLPLRQGADGDFKVKLMLVAGKHCWSFELATPPITPSQLQG
jgi:hypothetical protein